MEKADFSPTVKRAYKKAAEEFRRQQHEFTPEELQRALTAVKAGMSRRPHDVDVDMSRIHKDPELADTQQACQAIAQQVFG